MTTSISKEFTVRRALAEEVVDILREPRLMLASNLHNLEEIKQAAASNAFYVVLYESYRMLFAYKLISSGIYEIHIATPFNSILASRLLTYIALKWVYLKELPNIKYFVTNSPVGKIANFIRKTGAKQLKQVGDTIYFIATPEQLQLT